MNIEESDLQLLEEHLDGALDGVAETALLERLRTDTALRAELRDLESQRAVRQAAYRSMEPSELASQQLLWRVRGAMLNEQRQDQQQKPVVPSKRRWDQWQIARIGSAAAACLVLGFFTGRMGRGVGNSPVSAPSQTPANLVSNGSPGFTVADNHISQFTPVAPAPRISVPITNEYGQVVAWQTFDNPEQAKNFAEDLGHTHAQQSVNSAQPKLVDSPQQVPF